MQQPGITVTAPPPGPCRWATAELNVTLRGFQFLSHEQTLLESHDFARCRKELAFDKVGGARTIRLPRPHKGSSCHPARVRTGTARHLLAHPWPSTTPCSWPLLVAAPMCGACSSSHTSWLCVWCWILR